jgi:hypothetical protein
MSIRCRRIRAAVVGGVAATLFAGSPARAQGPQASLTVEELKPIYMAATNLQGTAPVCVEIAVGAAPPPQNLSSELMFEEAAAMFGMLMLKYPRTKNESASQRSDRLLQQEDMLTASLNAYREAHKCHPDGAARHLRAALALVAAFERQLREQEKLPDGAPQYAALGTRAAELNAEIPTATTPCPTERVRTCHQDGGGATPAEVQETGYRAKGMGRSFLRVEIGVGKGALTYDPYATQNRINKEGAVGVAFRLSAGLRQLAGKRDRHVLLIGGFYSFQHISGPDSVVTPLEDRKIESFYRMIHGGGLMFEWGIRLREGAVSIHPGAEFGVQAFLGQNTFGQLRAGGSLGLCFVESLFCLTGRLQGPLQQTDEFQYRGGQFTIGFDIMRAIDRGVAKRSR